MPGEGLGTQDAKAHDLVETPAEIPDWNWQKMMNIQYLFDANRYIHVHTCTYYIWTHFDQTRIRDLALLLSKMSLKP